MNEKRDWLGGAPLSGRVLHLRPRLLRPRVIHARTGQVMAPPAGREVADVA